jgi:DNA-damage-inducible protein J
MNFAKHMRFAIVCDTIAVHFANGGPMAKTDTVTVRLDPVVKKSAEVVLKKLGLTVTQAVTLFFVQVSLRNGLPFPVEIPKNDASINTGNVSSFAQSNPEDDQGK